MISTNIFGLVVVIVIQGNTPCGFLQLISQRLSDLLNFHNSQGKRENLIKQAFYDVLQNRIYCYDFVIVFYYYDLSNNNNNLNNLS